MPFYFKFEVSTIICLSLAINSLILKYNYYDIRSIAPVNHDYHCTPHIYLDMHFIMSLSAHQRVVLISILYFSIRSTHILLQRYYRYHNQLVTLLNQDQYGNTN